ncbi:MAG: hypothetical protein R2774_01775 [Saprospiraceae bacterium]
MKGKFTILFILFAHLAISQSKSCFTKCTIDAIQEENIVKHYIFTGSDTSGMNVKKSMITVAPARSIQVRKFDKNCTKPNPQDCYYTKVENIPPVTMNLYTLSDPSITDQYEIKEETITVVKSPAKEVEKEVICEQNRTTALIKKIQEGLIVQGFPIDATGVWDEPTRLSLNAFQKSNKLAYGDMTLESLALLGVE